MPATTATTSAASALRALLDERSDLEKRIQAIKTRIFFAERAALAELAKEAFPDAALVVFTTFAKPSRIDLHDQDFEVLPQDPATVREFVTRAKALVGPKPAGYWFSNVSKERVYLKPLNI